MSYATMLVHLGFDAAADGHVRLAVDLANAFDATLIGAAAWAPRPPFVAGGVVVDGVLADEEFRYIREQLAAAEGTFRSIAATARQPVEWRSAVDFPADFVIQESRAADLVIVGADKPPADAHRPLVRGSVALAAGRPVLAVPAGVTSLDAGRILIAWKDCREARRAVRDALPFLHRATEIVVATVCEDRSEQQALKGVDDVARYLARHGVPAPASPVVLPGDAAGQQLLRLAEESRSDLIVAGAYGRSRLGEWIFGGTTRALMTTSPRCCLFSH